jgi:hypothetical protein
MTGLRVLGLWRSWGVAWGRRVGLLVAQAEAGREGDALCFGRVSLKDGGRVDSPHKTRRNHLCGLQVVNVDWGPGDYPFLGHTRVPRRWQPWWTTVFHCCPDKTGPEGVSTRKKKWKKRAMTVSHVVAFCIAMSHLRRALMADLCTSKYHIVLNGNCHFFQMLICILYQTTYSVYKPFYSN